METPKTGFSTIKILLVFALILFFSFFIFRSFNTTPSLVKEVVTESQPQATPTLPIQPDFDTNPLIPIDTPPEPVSTNQATVIPTQVPASEDISLLEKTSYYPVYGKTAKELRINMNSTTINCLDDPRSPYDACTTWYVNWYYTQEIRAGECHPEKITLKVDVSYNYPQWADQSQSDPSTISRWDEYYKNLLTHEAGHKDNALNGAKKILATLSTLPGYSTCQELDGVVNQTAKAILREVNQNDIDYDAQTNHGATQGATFP